MLKDHIKHFNFPLKSDMIMRFFPKKQIVRLKFETANSMFWVSFYSQHPGSCCRIGNPKFALAEPRLRPQRPGYLYLGINGRKVTCGELGLRRL